MNLPRILVLDDLFFWSKEDRQNWCHRLALADVTDGQAVKGASYIAEAVFRSAQIRIGNKLINSVEEALKAVAEGWWTEEGRGALKKWSLVLLDLQFDEGSVLDGSIHPDTNWPDRANRKFGLEVLESLARVWPDPEAAVGNCDVPVVMLSRLAREEVSKQAGRAGARAYIEKQDLTNELLEDILNEHGLVEDDSSLLVGRSLPLLKTLRTAREVAHNYRGNLLLLGETGSGKTVLADYIHSHSPRAQNELHAFTVSEGYETSGLNAELFGYWYGAFTDAHQSEAGKAERAHESTLLIDEIGNLPNPSQGLLLEYCRLRGDGRRRLKRLGNFPTRADIVRQANESLIGEYNRSTQEITVDVFLIAATNARIDEPTYRKEKGFRDDLYYRLAEEYHKSIEFPSLRERIEDIALLFTYYVEKANSELGGMWPKEFNEDVLNELRAYDWPGNIAQLKGVAREVAKNTKNWEEVSARHLPRLSPSHPSSVSGISVRHQESAASRAESSILAADKHAAPPLVSSPISIDDVVRGLDSAVVSMSRNGLQGKLLNLQDASARLAMRLLEAALEETKDQKGELQPTSALKRLLDKHHLPSTEAASHLLRLSKTFPESPAKYSNLALALEWAKKRRRTSS
jgi:DNA-binding NtrC family response regulator